MIRKSVKRFSEKIILNQRPKARWWFNLFSSRFRLLLKGRPRAGLFAGQAGWQRLARQHPGYCL